MRKTGDIVGGDKRNISRTLPGFCFPIPDLSSITLNHLVPASGSFNKYPLNDCCVSGTALAAGNRPVNKTQSVSCPHVADSSILGLGTRPGFGDLWDSMRAPNISHVLSNLILELALCGKYHYCPRFTGKKTKAQRGPVTCSRSHS